MERLEKHLGKLKDIGEFPFKWQLDRNASDFLREIGVRSGQTILDFGCGSGTFTIPAAKLVEEDGRIYAMDVDESALDELRDKVDQEGLGNIEVIETSRGGKIPLGDGELDLILLVDVLHDVENRKILFEQAHKKLGPNGAIIVYPMHIGKEEVGKLAERASFKLKRDYQDHILIFEKK